jgi:hypothetical protein
MPSYNADGMMTDKVALFRLPKDRTKRRGRNLEEFASSPLVWLWKGRVLEGAWTILEGDGGCGKTMLLCDFIARWTTGRPFPEDPTVREPLNVLFLSSEDSIALAIRPRLEAAGADSSRVTVVDCREHPLRFLDHPEALLELIDAHQIKVVLIETLVNHFGQAGQRTEIGDEPTVRAYLAPLELALATRKVGCVAVRHWTKARTELKQRGAGSAAIFSAARLAIAVTPDKDDADLRLMGVIKCNYGIQVKETLAYRIETAFPEHENAEAYARVSWQSTIHRSLEEILAPGDGGLLSRCEAAIRDLLAGGPRPAKEAKKELNEQGFTFGTIEKAKSVGKFKSLKLGKAWYWELPHQAPETLTIIDSPSLTDLPPRASNEDDNEEGWEE